MSHTHSTPASSGYQQGRICNHDAILAWTSAVVMASTAVAPPASSAQVFGKGSQPGDVTGNLQALQGIASLAAAQSVELLVLPELFLQGYGTSAQHWLDAR